MIDGIKGLVTKEIFITEISKLRDEMGIRTFLSFIVLIKSLAVCSGKGSDI